MTSWLGASFGEKLWNTTISTTATTTQSSKFFARSFMSSFWCALGLDPRQLALRQRIHFRRTLARGRGLADHHLGITPPQLPHVVVEPRPLEQLDQERPAFAEVAVGEVHGEFRQVHRAGLVHRIHTALIGG